jgi:MFS family permease
LTSSFRVYLFTSFTGDLVVPIFSLFIPLLAAELGASPAEIGVVGGASYLTYSFMPFVFGRYSDRLKILRVLMISSLVVLTVVSLLYFFVATPIQLIAVRIVEGVGWSMLWPMIQAAIADDVQMDVGKSLGLYNIVWSAAAAIGPLVAVALIFVFQSIRTIFLLSVILLFATIVVNLIPVLRERSSSSSSRNNNERRRRMDDGHPLVDPEISPAGVEPQVHVTDGSLGIGAGGAAAAASFSVWFYLAALAFIMAVRGILFTFALPLAQSVGVPVLLIGSFAFFFGASRFATYLFTMRDDFRGWFLARTRIRLNVMAMLLLASIGGILPIVPDRSGVMFLISFVLCGIAASGISAISQVEMIGFSPGKRGENAGLLESSIGVGAGIGPIVAGQLAGGSLLIPFYFPVSGIFLVIPVLLWATRRSTKKPIGLG